MTKTIPKEERMINFDIGDEEGYTDLEGNYYSPKDLCEIAMSRMWTEKEVLKPMKVRQCIDGVMVTGILYPDGKFEIDRK